MENTNLEELELKKESRREIEQRPTHTLKTGITEQDLLKGTVIEFNPEEDEYYNIKPEYCYDVDEESNTCRMDFMEKDFDTLRMDMTPISDDKQVYKKIITEGTGNVATSKSLVTVHYNMYLELSAEPFDSTRLRSQVSKTLLGEGRMIMGLEMGICTMKKGETSLFLISPDYAFGKLGIPPRIPANSEILIEVELIHYIDSTHVLNFQNLSLDDQKALGFDHFEEVVKTEHQIGNDFFKEKKYGRALHHYIQSIRYLEKYSAKNEEEDKKRERLLVKLYLNTALVHLRLLNAGKVIYFARKVLDIEPGNTKALYRSGRAMVMNNDYETAKKMYGKAHNREPTNVDIIMAIEELDKIERKNRLVEKTMCQKMFNYGNTEEEEKGLPTEVLDKLKDSFTKMTEEETPEKFPISNNLNAKEREAVEKLAEELGLKMLSEDGEYFITK